MNNKRNGGNPKILNGTSGISAKSQPNQGSRGGSNGTVAKMPAGNGAAQAGGQRRQIISPRKGDSSGGGAEDEIEEMSESSEEQ